MRVGTTGEKLKLPRVFTIRGFPLRYKLQKGYFMNGDKDICNVCHQIPCECDEINADLTNSLEYKKNLRAKKKNNRETGEASSSGDTRSQRLAQRGAKGKEAKMKRTAKQSCTPCNNYWNKGYCKFGDKCEFKRETSTTTADNSRLANAEAQAPPEGTPPASPRTCSPTPCRHPSTWRGAGHAAPSSCSRRA